MIKFYDLNKQDSVIEKKIIRAITRVINKKNFINGEEVFLFEKKFAQFSSSKYSIGCSNGTDALFLALKSLELKKGDEVILPGMTYISTVLAIVNSGLKPVLVDIDNKTGLMDLNLLKSKITNKTRVIMPVHLYGNIIDINKIKKIINKKILIIDDASQAHGGYLKKKINKVGSMAFMSCFSLYPGKNLGSYGDAGIITTNNIKIKKKLEMLTNLGLERSKKYDHEILGFNNRLDTIQASILIEKIKYLNINNSKRIRIADLYNKEINNPQIKKIEYVKGSVFHQYIILVKDREGFQKYMLNKKIQTGIHYPNSINMHKATKRYFNSKETPKSRRFCKECVSLPIDPFLKKSEIKKIIKAVNKYKS